MSKSIRIFESFEEQEEYHKERVLNSTVEDRFRKLYQMQQLTKSFILQLINQEKLLF